MKIIIVSVTALILMLSSTISFAEEEVSDWTANLNLFFGGKTLDKDDWEPVEEHGEFGIQLDLGKKSWPVNIAVDSVASVGMDKLNGEDVQMRTQELNIGVKKNFSFSGMTPFLGGGISFISAEANPQLLGLNPYGSGVTYWMEAQGTGIWISGGVYWILMEHLNLGFEAKLSRAKAKFDGIDDKKQIGGNHFGLILGYHW